MKQIPTIGRIVIYNTTEAERQAMSASANQNEQKQLPAIIVSTWGKSPESAVNLKVLLDGEGELWKTSAPQGSDPGSWEWPTIKKDEGANTGVSAEPGASEQKS